MANGYKSVNELTAEQFSELKDGLDIRIRTGEISYPECGLEYGAELTDEAVRLYYGGTMFTDDDFFCTAGKVTQVSASESNAA
jgi:hypothetical protein